MMVRRGVGILVLLSLTVAVPYESKEPLRKHKSKPDACETRARAGEAAATGCSAELVHLRSCLCCGWSGPVCGGGAGQGVGYVGFREGVGEGGARPHTLSLCTWGPLLRPTAGWTACRCRHACVSQA